MINDEDELETTSNPLSDGTQEDIPTASANETLRDNLIRNDTIPETSRDTPGSNGAFPVGAFDTSKDDVKSPLNP